MYKKYFCLALFLPVFAVSGCVTDDAWTGAAQTLLNGTSLPGAPQGSLTTEQITLGLKEALNVGTGQVVTQLGRSGGFNLDPKIRIPLPPAMAKVDSALKQVGMASLTEDLQNRMNEAAELAVPEAKELFIASIRQMTIADARSILSGQQDAATQYLRKTMGPDLAAKIQPIINTSLARAGAVQAYDRVASAQPLLSPLLSNVKTDMNAYVTEKALDGVFYYVAKEEAAIRQNPAKRTTDLLKAVFGSADSGR